MSNQLIDLLFNLAPHLHWISFSLLLLAGFNLPISEDLVLIISGSVAATILPENTIIIFLGCLLGAYASDVISYFIGKHFVHGIVNSKFLSHIFHPEKIDKMSGYFHKYGEKVIFFGRFIPFGVRNVIFMTSGLVRIPLRHFLVIDFLALIITSFILFTAGYKFGKNYQDLLEHINNYKIYIIVVVVIVVSLVVKYEVKIHKKEKNKAALSEKSSSNKK